MTTNTAVDFTITLDAEQLRRADSHAEYEQRLRPHRTPRLTGFRARQAFTAITGVADYGSYMIRAKFKKHPSASAVLRIFEDDVPSRIYILAVTEDDETFTFAGWIHGDEAQQPEFERTVNDKKEWQLPSIALRPMNTLPAMEEQ